MPRQHPQDKDDGRSATPVPEWIECVHPPDAASYRRLLWKLANAQQPAQANHAARVELQASDLLRAELQAGFRGTWGRHRIPE
jgi:hypothetical protein